MQHWNFEYMHRPLTAATETVATVVMQLRLRGQQQNSTKRTEYGGARVKIIE